MSLDKVLRLAAGQAPAESPAAAYIRAAAQDLDELALLLAKASDEDDDQDDDGEGGDDSDSDEDDDEDDDPKGKKKFKSFKKGKKKGKPVKDGDKVKAAALLLDAMVALHSLQGGENISLSVLSQKDREKASAHTIPGTTDFPIPDKAHLSAAIARYKQGALAGHPSSVVKKHILSAAKRLGETVELTEEDDRVVLLGLTGKRQDKVPADVMVAMEHGPHIGSHSHPYRASHVVNAEHVHNHDSQHDRSERSIY